MEREEKQRRAEEARHRGAAASALPAAAEAQRKAAAAAAAARDRMRREQTNLVASKRLQQPQPGRGPVGRRLDEANSKADGVTSTPRLEWAAAEAARAKGMRDVVSDQLRGAATGLVRRSGDAGRESRDHRTRAKMLLVALARLPQRLPFWAITLLFVACVSTAGFCGYLCTRAFLDSYDAGLSYDGADNLPSLNHVRNRARSLRPPPPPRDMEFGRAPRKQAARPPLIAETQGSDRTVCSDAAQQHGLRGAAADARGARQCKQARHSVA